MSDLEARIAEVLAGHAVMTAQHINTKHPVIQCKCDAEVTGGGEKWREHQAAMLAPVIAEAKAEALREAAAIVASEEAYQWRMDRGAGVYGMRVPGAQIVAQRMQVVGKIITARAEELATS